LKQGIILRPKYERIQELGGRNSSVAYHKQRAFKRIAGSGYPRSAGYRWSEFEGYQATATYI
jgi:hypothetical protein